jgi:hypothetical protein
VTRVFAAARSVATKLAGERGIAMVMSLGMSSVLAISGTSAVLYTTGGERAANRSKAELRAKSLAEAGVNYAFATLHNAPDPTLGGAVPARSVPLEGGTVEYYGTLDQETNRWTLTGIGRVASPNPGGNDVVRIVRGRARIGSSTHGSDNNAVWNYVYADATSGCTSIGNSVNVNVPLYVRGNLCLSNSANMTGYSLQVGGTLSISNSARIGTTDVNAASDNPSNPQVHEVHVAGGCRLGTSGPFTTPCGPAQRVYSEVAPDASPTGLTKPPVDLPGWYQNAYPGPMHGCTTGSFPGGFDTDTVMNRSRGTVTLNPSTSYDCQVRDAQNNLVGRIAWNPVTKALTIHGTIFFDGNIEFANSSQVFYSGRATIYSSGTIRMRNSTYLCGHASCNEGWDPLQNLLALVAGSSTDATGFMLENSSKFQGGVYAVNDYLEENSSEVWGPIIARQIHLQNSTRNHYVPLGVLLPGMPQTWEEAVSLVNEPGGWSY